VPGVRGPCPSNVLRAVTRALDMLEEARRVLGDPASRGRYDGRAAAFGRVPGPALEGSRVRAGAAVPALCHCRSAHGAADAPGYAGYASSLPRATLSASSTKLRTAGRSSPTRQAAHNDVAGTFLAGTKTRPGRALYSSDDAGHKLMP
jgi:hypothetical protein